MCQMAQKRSLSRTLRVKKDEKYYAVKAQILLCQCFLFCSFCRDMLSSIVHIVKECSDEVCIEHFKKGLVTCEGIIFKIFFLNDYANCCKTYTIRYCFSSKKYTVKPVLSCH